MTRLIFCSTYPTQPHSMFIKGTPNGFPCRKTFLRIFPAVYCAGLSDSAWLLTNQVVYFTVVIL
jgi:hypothetical protein